MAKSQQKPLKLNENGSAKAFPLMNQMANGAPNPHPDLTVMKPAATSTGSYEGHHPAEVADLSSEVNYYKYPWMDDGGELSAINWALLGTFAVIIAVCVYLLAGTKLVKFIQFFLAKKQYKRLKISIEEQPQQQADQEIIYQTPRPNMNLVVAKVTDQVGLQQQHQPRRQSGLASNLSFHARSLTQFYAPLLALCQLASHSQTLIVPSFVILSQVFFRAALLLTLTVAACLTYISMNVDGQEWSCLTSRDMQSQSFYCLNEFNPSDTSAKDHQGSLFLVGSLCAVAGSVIMFMLSQSIFKNFKHYLTMLAESAGDEMKSQVGFVNNLEISHNGQIEKVRQKSPKKKIRSPKKQRRRDSLSSFRNLLDRDSDSSMLPSFTGDQGYDSAAQMSMSTQANALNLSERGNLLNQSVNSVREAANIGGAGKKYPPTNALDLLPIDEDVDEQQCSPIKPKKRTTEDSPFKRHQNGIVENSSDSQINHIAVGGFGAELDRKHDSAEMISLNLNLGLETPTNKKDMLQHSKNSIDQNLNGSQSESGFHFEVEKVAEKKEPGLKTVNSGPSNKQTEEETIGHKPTTYGVASSRNQISLNVGSFGGNSESTLQLETIAPVKPTIGGGLSAQARDSSKEILSDYNDQNNGVPPMPLSTRNDARQSQGMSLITPFVTKNEHTFNSGNEVQTEDMNSIGITYNRNIEALSSSGVSNQDSIRPDSGNRRRQRRQKVIKADELLQNFNVETQAQSCQQSETEQQSLTTNCKAAFLIIFIMAFVFGICMDAYFLHSLPAEGLSFVALGLAAAFVADFVIQCLVLLALSAVQFCYELRGKELPLDTKVLVRMTAQRREMAMLIFTSYKEQSALLKVDFQDEEDLLLEKLEAADIEKQSDSSSLAMNMRIEAKDILTKDTIFKLQIGDLKVSVSETLRFRPPRTLIAPRTKVTMNIISPKIKIDVGGGFVEPTQEDLRIGRVSSFVDVLGAAEEEDARRMRRPEMSKFERSKQFFADINPNSRKRLRSSQKKSPTKRSAQMLRESIENIELEKLEGDFSKDLNLNGQKGRSVTPDKRKEEAKSSLLYSPNKKMSQFETPKGPGQLSQVKLKHHGSMPSVDQSGVKHDSNHKVDSKSDMKSDVRRKLVMPKASITSMGVNGSIEEARKLSSQKNYLEDRAGQGLVGMLHSNSSKSQMKIEAGQETLQSNNVQYVSRDPEQFCYNSQDQAEARDPNNAPNQDVYSPIFSSVNRKAGRKIDNIKFDQQEQAQDAQVTNFAGLNMARIDNKVEKCVYSRQGTASKDLDLNEQSASKTGSNSQALAAALLSNRSHLPKQQSFNSPRSLHEQIQLTSEKINSSIEGSSINKGRRKMMLLDEAGLSKQSLQFGQVQNSSLANGSRSICGSSGNTTPLRALSNPNIMAEAHVARHNSVVLFEDQGEPDFQEEQQIQDTEGNVPGMAPAEKTSIFVDDQQQQSKTGTDDMNNSVTGGEEEKARCNSVLDNPRASIQSQMIVEQQKDREFNSNLQVSTEPGYAETMTDIKSQTTTTAFQRLVLASKRIMAKKSSDKKNIVPKSTAYAQARSMSQCGADTISIMKEQSSNAVFTQPFQVAKKNQRSSSDPQSIQRRSDQQAVKQTDKPVSTGLQAIMQSNQEPTYRNIQQQQQISVIKEQASMEVETPVGQPRIVDIKKQMSFSKEQVNPVKTPRVVEESSIVSTKKMSKVSIRNGVMVGAHLAPATANAQTTAQRYTDQVFGKNFKSRKTSQLSSKNGAATSGAGAEKKMSMVLRRSSKNSGNNNKDKLRNLNLTEMSGRENTMSSNLSLDFEKMDKQREEDYSDFSKMISNSSYHNRVDDQRRRLESFLSLAQQAKSKRDISKIQDMIRQIDETGKALPMTRINELRLLELMASPYNQSLIAMIQVELDMSRKVKEFKKHQQSNQNSKSKFSLPKHFINVQNSRLNVNEHFQIEDIHGKKHSSISGGARSTTVVNIRAKGIASCRSNNDVANRKFNRSPAHLNASPISVGPSVVQLSGNNHRENSSLSKRDNSVGRYSYLRNVGNSVLNNDVRKSVDRIRMSKENIVQVRSGIDLSADIKNKFEDGGRRGTAPVGFQPKSGLAKYAKPSAFALPTDSSGQNSQAELFMGRNDLLNQNRSKTSYGMQPVEGIGPVKQAFVKRNITPDGIQKDGNTNEQEKENVHQARARQ